jgi:hypothetical protein
MDNDRLRWHYSVSLAPILPYMVSSPNRFTQYVRRDARCGHSRSCCYSCGDLGIRYHWLDAHRHVLFLHVRLRGYHGDTDRFASRADLLQRWRQDGGNDHVVLRHAGAVLHRLQCHASKRENGVGILTRRGIPILEVCRAAFRLYSPAAPVDHVSIRMLTD